MRWAEALLALGVAGCAYGGTQVTHEMLSSVPLTQLLSGGDGVTRIAPSAVWHIWNDLNDPASKLSVESKIRRAALNSAGYTCKDYNARGDYLTKGLFYELGSMATGAQTRPNGGCVSGDRSPAEVYEEIRMLGGAGVDRVAAAATRIGFVCPQPAGGALACTANFVERETVRQPPEFVKDGEQAVTRTDYRFDLVLTYAPGQPAAISMTRSVVQQRR